MSVERLLFLAVLAIWSSLAPKKIGKDIKRFSPGEELHLQARWQTLELCL